MADEVGFEPTEPFGSLVFKTSALNHSATHPTLEQISHVRLTGKQIVITVIPTPLILAASAANASSNASFRIAFRA